MDRIVGGIIAVLTALSSAPVQAQEGCTEAALYEKYVLPPNCSYRMDGEKLAEYVLATAKIRGIALKDSTWESISPLHKFLFDLFQGHRVPYPIFENSEGSLWEQDRQFLMDYLLKQPDFSVKPHELILFALEHSHGDLSRTFKSIYNVLIQNRFSDTKRRITQTHILKLHDITGEEVIYDGVEHYGKFYVRGDKFNAWYHFFALAVLFFGLGEDTASIANYLFFDLFNSDGYEDPQKMLAIHDSAIDFARTMRDRLPFKEYSPELRYLGDAPQGMEGYCLRENQQTYEYKTVYATLDRYAPFMRRVYTFRRVFSSLKDYATPRRAERLACVIQALRCGPTAQTRNPELFDFSDVVIQSLAESQTVPWSAQESEKIQAALHASCGP